MCRYVSLHDQTGNNLVSSIMIGGKYGLHRLFSALQLKTTILDHKNRCKPHSLTQYDSTGPRFTPCFSLRGDYIPLLSQRGKELIIYGNRNQPLQNNNTQALCACFNSDIYTYIYMYLHILVGHPSFALYSLCYPKLNTLDFIPQCY